LPELDPANWPVHTLADWLDEFVAELLAETVAESPQSQPSSVNAELSSDVLFAVAEDELSWEPVTSDVFDASEEPDVTLALAVPVLSDVASFVASPPVLLAVLSEVSSEPPSMFPPVASLLASWSVQFAPSTLESAELWPEFDSEPCSVWTSADWSLLLLAWLSLETVASAYATPAIPSGRASPKATARLRNAFLFAKTTSMEGYGPLRLHKRAVPLLGTGTAKQAHGAENRSRARQHRATCLTA
jgi:hypothetical protein